MRVAAAKTFRPSSPDTFSKWITIIILFMLAGFIISPFIDELYFWPGLIVAAVVLITLFISLSLKPVEYILQDDHLLIRKQFGHTAKIENIKSAEPDVASGVRTFGVGGLFAYTCLLYTSPSPRD